MEGLHLDHIAIAVQSLAQARKVYEDIGFSFSEHIEEVPSQKVKTQFCQIDKKSRIELLEPTSPESTVAKFIQKKGEGIHHLCFRVEDVKAKQKELAAKGYRFIYEKPVPGADHCLVNFIHPSSTGGILIELSQKV
ncbi:MAG: methylmalonyl-CoA epimerase [Bacteriovoracaceae bacterium]|nr:methylmalonyl-CoA epimerase [Bacteriovoracaceae bacterium]